MVEHELIPHFVSGNAPISPRCRSDLLLSVVIPCMNEQEIVVQSAEALISTLGQGEFRFELIFVDDGSTDATPELLKRVHGTGFESPRPEAF